MCDGCEFSSCSSSEKMEAKSLSVLSRNAQRCPTLGALECLRLSFQLPECSSLELRELHPGVGRLDSLCTPGKAPPLGLPLLPACSPTTSALQCLHWTRMQFIKGLSAHTVLGGPSDPWHGFPRTLNTEACKRTWKGLGNLFCQWVPSW